MLLWVWTYPCRLSLGVPCRNEIFIWRGWSAGSLDSRFATTLRTVSNLRAPPSRVGLGMVGYSGRGRCRGSVRRTYHTIRFKNRLLKPLSHFRLPSARPSSGSSGPFSPPTPRRSQSPYTRHPLEDRCLYSLTGFVDFLFFFSFFSSILFSIVDGGGGRMLHRDVSLSAESAARPSVRYYTTVCRIHILLPERPSSSSDL